MNDAVQPRTEGNMTPLVRRSFFWLLLVAALSLLDIHSEEGSPDQSFGKDIVRSDVLVYVKAAGDMLQERHLYRSGEPDPYLYPPFYAFLNIPFCRSIRFSSMSCGSLNTVLIGVIIHQSYSCSSDRRS